MKTPFPDNDKMNDVSPPNDGNEWVDTEEDAPSSVGEVAPLSENCDEELLNPPAKDEPSELLKGKQSRRKK